MEPADIAKANSAYWASLYGVKLQSGSFSFKNHKYQFEPMTSPAARVCCMKATQGGFTEMFVLDVLHGMIQGRYPTGVLYLFPTTENVQDFSRSRFNPLIAANKETIGRYVKAGGKGTDSVGLKKVGMSFLYLRGARLSQQVGTSSDDKEAVGLRSVPVDCFVADELDLMDDAVIELARARMAHSLVKAERYLSNPTDPDTGISALYEQSDKRQWFRRCGCGAWTCAIQSFPNCVKLRTDGTGYIGCDKCGKELSQDDGQWVPAERENSGYMAGYQWSQLDSAFVDPATILELSNNPPNGDRTRVERMVLGRPYINAQDKLQPQAVRDCCGLDPMLDHHEGPCAMGSDIGKTKHVVIGVKTSRNPERYQIIKVARVGSFNDIHDLARRFNVRSAVLDIRPYEDEAKKFQKAEPYKIRLCEYHDNAVSGDVLDDERNVLKSYRTGIHDAVHSLFMQHHVVVPRQCPEIDVFVAQCCGVSKVLEEKGTSGTMIYRYHKSGAAGDHYRHAMAYFLLAARCLPVYSPYERRGVRRNAKSDYSLV
jgi:hypothetical protein